MPADPSPPRPPFRVEDVPWTEFSHGERFQIRYRALGDFGGCERIGTAIEELPPGKQSSPFISTCSKRSICGFSRGVRR
jgi:hypothetical protein